MAWVSVHQEVDGSKLRRLYKTIGCSKFEALGILNFLWFWGMKNADETGLVSDADLDVLSRYLYGCGEGSTLDMGKVVQALADVGWIDMAADGFYIHDWDQWQEQWYKLQKTRKRDAERKRRDYAETVVQPRGSHTVEQSEDPKEPKKADKKKDGPEKKSYAEFVKMTEANYESFDAAKSDAEDTLVNWIADECSRWKSDQPTQEERESFNRMIYDCSVQVDKYNPDTDEYEEYWSPSYEDEKLLGWEEI